MAETRATKTDLADALLSGEVARAAALLDAEPDRIREITPCRCRLLSMTVRSGQLPALQLLLERGADPIWPEDDAPGGRALYEAARAGRFDMAELLLSH